MASKLHKASFHFWLEQLGDHASYEVNQRYLIENDLTWKLKVEK
jgi:hypothetical protein